MHTLLLATIIFLGLLDFGSLSAQGFPDRGLKVGYSVVGFSGKDAHKLDADYLGDFLVGGFISHALHPEFALQGELVYSRKGGRTKDRDVNSEYKLSYLEVNALGKVLAASPEFRATILVGLSFGFLVGDAVEVSNTFVPTRDEKSGAVPMDFAWTAGLGWEKGPVGLEVRFTQGFEKFSNSIGFPDLKNRVFSAIANVRV